MKTRKLIGYFGRVSLPALLLAAVACTHPGAQKNDTPLPHETTIVRLLAEADSLIQCDTVFFNAFMKDIRPRICRNDSLVLAKMDSAIQLNPDRKRSYLVKYIYLMQGLQFDRILPLLRQMDTRSESMLSADLRVMKAILEDREGNTQIAQRDFLKADSCYAAYMEHCDSIQYGTYGLSRALNLSLMKNDFEILHREIELYDKVHHENIDKDSVLWHIKSKEDFYRFIFEGKE
ncbi:MAG: hypothetical protein Q4D36_10590 [Bacteroidales bacterium]|nr:hypothetical protein [Bacteroidales bacterium]